MIECQYQVRVDGGRTVTISGEIEDLDKILRILSSFPTTDAVLASAEALIALTKEERDRWRARAEHTKDEVARLRNQLPAGMEHCTILARECEKGHSWLTATNWVQHDCPWCEIERLWVERRLWRGRAAVPTVAQAQRDKADNLSGLRAAIAEAIDYLQRAPFNYANGVEAPGGMADEGTINGMEAHNRLIKRLKQALES